MGFYFPKSRFYVFVHKFNIRLYF